MSFQAFPAVLVQNACKSFTKEENVLTNFNMKVDKGTIFGLLGGSGSGKTTLLSCITGLKKLDSGDIFVNGYRPGSPGSELKGIGYMPQDLALYNMFKIKEIMFYFGIIYGMSIKQISERVKVLMDFLDLPRCSRLIKTMSGGEQKRVSLAVAMLHEPTLLILDEPTVGLDPLIRENIWEYLRELVSKHGATVLMSTHYIEEAKQCDKVGFLRNGRFLAEQPPQLLLEQYNAQTLEQVVLTLCKQDTQNACKTEATVAVLQSHQWNHYNPSFIPRKNLTEQVKLHFNKILALVVRNLFNFFRYPAFVFVLLAIPTLQISIFSVVVGKEPVSKHMGVINGDFKTTNLENYCENRNKSCFSGGLSCQYLELFGNNILWDPMESRDLALSSVTSGRSQGFITIPANFTTHLANRLVLKKFSSNDTIDGSTISIKIDNSDQLMNWFLLKHLYSNYFKFIRELVFSCGLDPRVVELPLKYNAIYGSEDTSAQEFMQTPTLLLTMFILSMSVSVAIIWEKSSGTLDRTLMAGVDFVHVVISFIISEGLLMLLQVTICLLVFVYFFKLQVQGSIFLCFGLAWLMGICGLSFGLLFGVMCDHQVDAFVCTMFTYSHSLVFAGSLWPKEGNELWVRIFSACFPLTLPSESIRSIVNRGWGLTHQNVWPGFAVGLFWITFSCVTSCYLQKVRK